MEARRHTEAQVRCRMGCHCVRSHAPDHNRLRSVYFLFRREVIVMNNSNGNVKGIGFFGLLAIAFIVLKLCGVITWAWWVVLTPIWVPALITVILLIVYVVLSGRG